MPLWKVVVSSSCRWVVSNPSVVAASPLVVVCVSDYDAVHELLDPLDEVLRGRVLVFVKALADQAVADGHGGNGYAAMIEQFRKPSSPRS